MGPVRIDNIANEMEVISQDLDDTIIRENLAIQNQDIINIQMIIDVITLIGNRETLKKKENFKLQQNDQRNNILDTKIHEEKD